MRMEPTESSETSAINVTWTPGTYPKDKKLQLEHGESLKSRILEQNSICIFRFLQSNYMYETPKFPPLNNLAIRVEVLLISNMYPYLFLFIHRTFHLYIILKFHLKFLYTGCNRRNGPDFGRVFLMLNYTENPKTRISKVQWLRRYRPEKSVDFFCVRVLYSICDVILGVSEGWAPSTTISFPRYR